MRYSSWHTNGLEGDDMLQRFRTLVYDLPARLFSPLQHVILLIMRLYWGWLFFSAGKTKLANIEGIVTYFEELKIPAPAFNAYFVSSLEMVGGMLLLLGLFSRLIALPLTINMIVAYLTADRVRVLHIFSEPEKFLAADPFFFLLVSALVLAFGPGLFALDTLIVKWLDRQSAAPEAARAG
ncbi:MAG: DoxX family protein [Thermoanaerobaculia bacterium]